MIGASACTAAEQTGKMLDVDHDVVMRTGLQGAPWVHEWIGTFEIQGAVRFCAGPFDTEANADAAVATRRATAEFARRKGMARG